FNVESEPELERLAAVASGMGRTAAVALRVNPDVDAGTHAKITTGTAENTFGIEFTPARAVAARMRGMAGVRLVGIAVHIGSQLTSVAPFRAAFDRVAGFARTLMAEDGHPLERLDLGGGLGVTYEREPPVDLPAYAAAALAATRDFPGTVVFEPGRWMVAEAGVLLARVVYVKKGSQKTFAILDTGMNDLIRPAMYDAHHPIRPVSEPRPGAAETAVDVVGPICESSDVIAVGRPMPPLAADDLLAIGVAGAYGAVMASGYNGRLLAPEVMVRDDAFAVVRARPSYEDVIRADRLAPWQLAASG
ncbi:MAG: diaminopimelate decarboxylase, partial [Alphaproteobacteria bacterium]